MAMPPPHVLISVDSARLENGFLELEFEHPKPLHDDAIGLELHPGDAEVRVVVLERRARHGEASTSGEPEWQQIRRPLSEITSARAGTIVVNDENLYGLRAHRPEVRLRFDLDAK